MKPIQLTLTGFKPLKILSNISSIEITPESNFTLILGTNGCGKSTLIAEWTPLSAQVSDYFQDGVKQSTWEHNGDIFEFTSYIKKSVKNDIYKNGELLFTGITATQQKEFVEKELNYSPLTHKLLIGDLKFTAMNPTQRRDILTMIASYAKIDLSYALQIHKLLKEEYRDMQGVLKHTVNKGSDARIKLNNIQLSEDIGSILLELESTINSVIPFCKTDLPNKYQLLKEREEHEVAYAKIINSIKRTKHKCLREENIFNREDLVERISYYNDKLVSSQTLITKMSEEVSELSDITENVNTGNLSKEDIVGRVVTIEFELTRFSSECFIKSNHQLAVDNLLDLLNQCEVIYSHLNGCLVNSIEEALEVIKEVEENKTNIGKAISLLNQLSTQIAKLELDDSKTNCPNCGTTFHTNPEYCVDNLSKFKSEFERISEHKVWLEKQIKSNNGKYDHAVKITIYEKELDKIKRTLKLPLDFWNKFPSFNQFISNQSRVNSYIHYWKANIENGLKRNKLLEELENYNKVLSIFEKYGDSIDSKRNLLISKIESEVGIKNKNLELMNHCKTILSQVDNYDKVLNDLDLLHEKILKLDDLLNEVEISNDAIEFKEIKYKELVELRNQISNRDSLSKMVEQYDLDYKTAQLELESLKQCEMLISPVEGLIAEQISGFIKSFIGGMKDIISSIWEYEIHIGMCNSKSGDLDYYFPMTIGELTVSDISSGSEAQVDVINLSFILMMRQYMGLTNYPIYFDETGRSFDEKHRVNLMTFVKRLVDNQMCSHVVMVNHFASMHGGLTNCDTIVLNEDNIILPSKYNQGVVIK